MNKKTFLRKFNMYICDMETHTINYYGINLTVHGNYEETDESTGYKGGWLSASIFAGNENVMPIMMQSAIDDIDEQVLKENY